MTPSESGGSGGTRLTSRGRYRAEEPAKGSPVGACGGLGGPVFGLGAPAREMSRLGMVDPVPSRVLLLAVLSLLTDALEQEETRHFATDQLRADLDGLRIRVERELQPRGRLHLADGPPG